MCSLSRYISLKHCHCIFCFDALVNTTWGGGGGGYIIRVSKGVKVNFKNVVLHASDSKLRLHVYWRVTKTKKIIMSCLNIDNAADL